MDKMLLEIFPRACYVIKLLSKMYAQFSVKELERHELKEEKT